MSDGKRKALIAVSYIGGYDESKKAAGMLSFYDSHVMFKAFLRKIEIPMHEVKNISIEPPEEVGKRVTMTRLVALGVFSLFLKKAKKEAYIVLELKDGREVIFHANGVTHMDVRAKLSTTIAQLKAA